MSKININYYSLLILLSLAGLLGNYLSFGIFFGVSFIFGSVAVLVAVRLLGTVGAVIVACLAGSYTYVLWGHPYAIIIFAAEALVVGLLVQRKISSLVLSDIFFWIVIGMPIVWLFYSGVMHMGQTPTFMIALKQAVNGVANAIVATYLLFLIPQKYIIHKSAEIQGKIQLNELLFTTLLGISLLFAFVTVSFENRQMKEILERALTEQLHIYHEHLEEFSFEKDLNKIHDDRLRHKNKFDVMIFTGTNSFVDSTLPFDQEIEFTHQGSIKTINEKLSLWMPERNNMPLMLWWNKAYYFVSKPIRGNEKGKIYVMQNTQTIIKKVQSNILTSFELLLALIIIGGAAAFAVSRSLTGTIVKLTSVTKNLPDKLKRNFNIDWPKSQVAELMQLSKQTEMMSDNISETFNDVTLQAKTILETSIDSIITTDEQGFILGFNSAAEKLFGYSKVEIIGRNIEVLIPALQLRIHKMETSHVNVDEDISLSGHRVETTAQDKKGNVIFIEISITKTDLNGKITFTAIITDISQRKANEQLKRDFISTVSHELRTPLTSINGSVKLIQAQLGNLDQEAQAKLLDVTVRNINRLTFLINDLLDFEKLQASSVEYSKEIVSARQLIADVVEQNQSFAEQGRITLKETIQDELTFMADPQRIFQVIVNLVSNAIKFSPENEVVEIGCCAEGDNVRIYIVDHGNGIPDEYKERIFERFTQVDSADNRKIQRGTGLGLAISKQLTEGMGGTIGVESFEGQGSTFYVTFAAVK